MITTFLGEYRFLSNFYPARVIFEGITYPSVEHAYQAAKTLDKDAREKICRLETAGKAKREGRCIVQLRSDWERVKTSIMYDLVSQKFSTSSVLRNKLLATGTQQLVEGNYWNDTFWGVCNGKGQNHLGKILMRVREELK